MRVLAPSDEPRSGLESGSVVDVPEPFPFPSLPEPVAHRESGPTPLKHSPKEAARSAPALPIKPDEFLASHQIYVDDVSAPFPHIP